MGNGRGDRDGDGDQHLERLGPAHLRAVAGAYRDALRSHQEPINRLNVYPVPDGDTGTNMALTLASVVDALEGADDMEATCTAIARGSLMGARGNSGVILSQILRGVTQRCRDEKEVGAVDLADALHQASQAAYGAVMKPVEGTILTVAKGAAEAAQEAAAGGKSLVEVVQAARQAACEALDRTPELLPVLAEAGVVDAGGLGYVLFFDSLLHVVAGLPLPEPEPVAEGVGVDPATAPSGGDGGVGDLRYEVMYFLEAPDDEVPAFKEA
ncbi:MAG TPA: DAK2 domain-containing protein, partial [Acidimicrobiales bacterium]|nr:DAK2 domain-containing protein [Acidimicrobiales bacterium]